MPFFQSQVQGNMIKVLKTLALEKLINSIFPDFAFKNRTLDADFTKNVSIWMILMRNLTKLHSLDFFSRP